MEVPNRDSQTTLSIWCLIPITSQRELAPDPALAFFGKCYSMPVCILNYPNTLANLDSNSWILSQNLVKILRRVLPKKVFHYSALEIIRHEPGKVRY